MAKVIGIKIWGTGLKGSIPSEFCSLSNIKTLSIWGIELENPLPKEFGNLITLKYLYIRYAGTKVDNIVSKEIGNLINLTSLSIFHYGTEVDYQENKIPKEIGNLSNLLDLVLMVLYPRSLYPKKYLNLVILGGWGYQITKLGNGVLAKDISNLKNLSLLSVSESNLGGEIPKEIGELINLRWIWLSENNLGGAIPKEIGNLTNLEALDIGNNLYNFKDIEPVFNWPDSIEIFANEYNFRYSPQAKVGTPDTIYTDPSNQIELSITDYEPDTADHYQWYKNNKFIGIGA